MRLWHFTLGGLTLAFASVCAPLPTIDAADGLMRGRIGGVTAQPASTGPVVTRTNSNAKQSAPSGSVLKNGPSSGPVMSRPIILGSKNPNNSAITSSGWKKYTGQVGGSPGGAAPNGNTGISGIGLPGSPTGKIVSGVNRGPIGAKTQPSGAKTQPIGGVAMFRGVSPAPSGALQTKANKLAGGVPMLKTQKGIFGEIGQAAGKVGNALDDAANTVLESASDGFNDLFADFGTNETPAIPPAATTSKLPAELIEAPKYAEIKPLPGKRVELPTTADTTVNPLARTSLGNGDKIGLPGGSNSPSNPGQQNPSPDETPNPPTNPSPDPSPNPPSNPQNPDNKIPKLPKLPKVPFPIPVPIPGRAVIIERPVVVAQPVVVGAAAPVAAGSPDLVLEDLKLMSPATSIAGPAYRLKFRNQGTGAAGNFQVAMLAGFAGNLADDAPRAVVEVPGLFAGESLEVTLRLPASAMRMAHADYPRPVACTHLYVGVDFQASVAEVDETNNIAVVPRSEIK